MTKKLSNSDYNAINQFNLYSHVSKCNNSTNKVHFERLYHPQSSNHKIHHFSPITIGQTSNSNSEERCCLIRLIQAIYNFICKILCCRKNDATDESKPDFKPNKTPIKDKESNASSDEEPEEEKYPEETINPVSSPQSAEPLSPLGDLLVKNYNPETNRKNQAEFKARIKHLSPAQIREGCKKEKDAFKFVQHLSWSENYPFTVIHESMNEAQFKAFLAGMIEIDFPRILTFINKATGEKKNQLFNDILEIIGRSGDPDKFWESLASHHDVDVEFARYAVIASLKNGQHASVFSQINKANHYLLENALKEHFIKSVTIEEWQKANAWAKENRIEIQQIPQQVLQFQAIKGDSNKVVAHLKKICVHGTFNGDKITKSLTGIMHDISVRVLEDYASDAVNAFNVVNNDYSTAVPIINALSGEKLDAFIKITYQRPGFGIQFLKFIKEDTFHLKHPREVGQTIDIYLQPILQRRNQFSHSIDEGAFRKNIQALSSEQILTYCKQDIFSIDDVRQLNLFYRNMRPEQFKSFLLGMSEKCFDKIVAFVFGLEEASKNSLFDFLVEIVEKNPAQLWPQLRSYHNDAIAFARHAVAAFLKKDFEPHLFALQLANRRLLENVLKEGFVNRATFEEWKKVSAWAAPFKIEVDPMPLVVIQFHAQKEGTHAAFLKDICVHRSLNNFDITQKLKDLMRYISADNIRLFASEKVNAFNVLGDNYQTVNPILNALIGDKLAAFIETTYDRPGFGIRFLQYIKSSILGIENRDALLSIVERYLKPLLERELLQRFEAVRNNPQEVAKVLTEAMGSIEGQSYFALIANVITEEELKKYADSQLDCFGLSKFSYQHFYDPIVSLKDLSPDKLKIFIQSVFSRKDMDYKLFNRMLRIIEGSSALVQAALFPYIIHLIITNKQFSDYLMDIPSTYAHFARHYLSYAQKCSAQQMDRCFELLYKKNRTLFEYNCADDLQSAKKWLKEQLAKDPTVFELKFLGDKNDDQLLTYFQSCRKNPDQVRSLFLDNLRYESFFKMIVKDMSVEEISNYASTDNNCFGIKNSSGNRHFELLFQLFVEPEKMRVLIVSTLARSDLKKGKVELDMLHGCNDLKSPFKESALSTLIQTLAQLDNCQVLLANPELRKEDRELIQKYSK